MRFNAYLYVIIWTLSVGFNLLMIFWSDFNINVTMLIKDTLTSSPLIEFEVSSNISNIEDSGISRLGPYFLWPGRTDTFYDSINDVYYDATISDPQYIYSIYGNYFDYKNYKTYEELLNNNYIIKKDLECKEGFKNCGTIDTLEQQLCLPENISCPLNDIEIIKTEQMEEFEYYIEKGYNFKRSNSYDIIFFYSNKQIEKPIIGRIVLNGGQPCANPLEITWEKVESHENNSSRKCKNKYKGNLYDETYIKFGNISYKDLYYDNLKKEDFEDMYYKYLDTVYFGLYKNRFIGIDKKCLKKSNIKDIPETTNMVDLLDGVKFSSMFFGAFNLLFIILIIIFDLCYHKFEDEEDSYLDLPEKFYIPLNAVAFLSYMFCFTYFVERTADFDCSDEITNNKVSLFNRRILIMKIGTFGYDLLFFIFVIIVCLRRIYKVISYGKNVFSDYFNI